MSVKGGKFSRVGRDISVGEKNEGKRKKKRKAKAKAKAKRRKPSIHTNPFFQGGGSGGIHIILTCAISI